MAEQPTVYKCPDCGKEFNSERALGPHRNKAHGYRLSDGKSDPKRKWSSRPKGSKNLAFVRHKGKFPCPHCDFVASWTGGLKHHVNKKHNNLEATKGTELAKDHQNAISSNQNGNIQADDDRNHRLEAAATFAAGRVTELLQGIAIKHDLPPRTLAALVLRVVHSETVR